MAILQPRPSFLLRRRRRVPAGLAAAVLLASCAIAAAQSAGDPASRDPPRRPWEGNPTGHEQPSARDFASPGGSDVTPAQAREIEQIYRQLMGQDFAPKS